MKKTAWSQVYLDFIDFSKNMKKMCMCIVYTISYIFFISKQGMNKILHHNYFQIFRSYILPLIIQMIRSLRI